ncbi:hypothetical protein IHE44_0006501 [Lamprotornis superbus]|uniref:E3 ubiquitin-protein ligase ZFP91 n=1 Tax=Lamprotornis superbus TaxID=245042 RepID=A0A835TRM0_9PASS|nr:hypothetical protein IHE44_0006501 [Lamprotornis superbus]
MKGAQIKSLVKAFCTMMKEPATPVSAPKEEKEEEEESSVLSHGSPTGTARPSRSWRSSRTAAATRQRDSENSRTSRSKANSLQLICKSEPNADQLEYGMWDMEGLGTVREPAVGVTLGMWLVLVWCCLSRVPSATSTPGSECRRRYLVTEEHQPPDGVSSDDDEEMLISEEEVPFKDDPRDETYKPHLEKEAPKQRRKASKGKEEKERQKEIKVEVKEENEFQEDEEPPRNWDLTRAQKNQLFSPGCREVKQQTFVTQSVASGPDSFGRGRRRKDDKSPRLPKRRKKPPIQYVRCEMEGCGTVLAHPRYLQHHIKYQHLLKKKYVCPHPSCGRLFRLQKQLLRHAKHHTDQRDYICEYCARAFKSSHNLAVHRMIHTGEKPLQCEICGFTCRQKASLNWHMKKHDADSFYQFSCNICGKKFEKKDSVVAHKAKSHPEVLIAEALAANAGALITSTDILGTNPEAIVPPTDGQGLPLLPDPLGSAPPADCLLLSPEGMPKPYCGGAERVSLVADGKLFVGSGSSANPEGLVMNTEMLEASTEVLIEDSDSTGP